jgi:UDP-N-acetyl-D-mannosaminouronate:lipid I N-acetyl-D-mannosaminouronosyltransferase
MENYWFILNKKIHAFSSRTDLLDFIDDKQKILIALNAEKLNKNDVKLNSLINDNIGYPDGIGAVMALRRKGVKAIKIPGAEFWLDIIERYQSNKSFYFIGATQEVIEKTMQKLRVDFPELNVKGARNGFLKENEILEVIEQFNNHKPDIVFVAMGRPKQEFVMKKLLEEDPALYMGLGGSFDVYAGFKKRAPKAFQILGLEWLYRLLKEPTRISRQIILVKFFFKIIFDKL